MSNLKKKRNDRSSAGYRPLMIAALVASGILQPLLPVLAAGTAADTGISNTATAEYKDDAGTDFKATSNTVTIQVAPIAGLTIKATGITDVNGGALEVSDQAIYKFDVTNVGNTPEDIFIPSTPATTGIDPTTIVVTYQLTDSLGALIGSPIVVPAGGATIPGVLADQVVKVTVTANVKTTGISAGDPVSVTLGNAGTNNNDPATTQNIVKTGALGTDEVRTVTLTTPTYTVNKEASASQSLPFASAVTPQAFALIKKTASSVPGATSAGNDDIINYNLNLSVLDSSPNGSFSPANLVGTNIKVGQTVAAATTQSKILVSDAIPAGTVLQPISTVPGAVPAGWTPVYSIDSVDATIPISSTELGALPAATWTTTAPTDLKTVKRVGFILDSSSATAGIAVGSAAVNFPISVITSGLPNNGGKVYNMAQAFGQTKDDTTNKVVLDESGDSAPSNFNNDGTVGPVYDPKTDTGKADPINQGIDGDPLNPNTGVGPKGEDTVSDITGTVTAAVDSLLNGPNGTPAAVGPTDANDDFTNASTQPPAGQSPLSDITTAQTASFKNTVKNPGGTDPNATVANVAVQPIAPSKAYDADGNAATTLATGQYGVDADIPVGTTVTITELNTLGVETSKTATYTYSVTGGVGSFTTTDTPVNLGTLAVNGVVNYKTVVNFPANTIKPLQGVSIPIVAFADTGTAGFDTESTNNITIDRVYTGFMKLVKEARVLDTDGTKVLQDWTDATTATTPGTLNVKPAPGQFIEYRIRYENVSTAANGSGNVVLNAKQFKLVEDGVFVSGVNPNTWASVTTHQQNTIASPGSTLNFFNEAGSTIGTTDPSNGTDVGKYENTVATPIAPGSQGVFQFRRLVK